MIKRKWMCSVFSVSHTRTHLLSSNLLPMRCITIQMKTDLALDSWLPWLLTLVGLHVAFYSNSSLSTIGKIDDNEKLNIPRFIVFSRLILSLTEKWDTVKAVRSLLDYYCLKCLKKKHLPFSLLSWKITDYENCSNRQWRNLDSVCFNLTAWSRYNFSIVIQVKRHTEHLDFVCVFSRVDHIGLEVGYD